MSAGDVGGEGGMDDMGINRVRHDHGWLPLVSVLLL